jgi:plastocyanin
MRLPLLFGALGAFLIIGELTFGPLGASDTPAAVVHMHGSAFGPADVSIASGQSVQFTNDDDAPHTATAADKSFDSGNLDPGKSWTHSFDTPGTYVYGCTYHSWMHGSVKVVRMAQNVRFSAGLPLN